MHYIKKNLSGWSNYSQSNSYVHRPENLSDIQLSSFNSIIPRGLGRSYGDAALNMNGHVILTERLNRFLAFDSKTGVVRAECGVTYADLLSTFVPRGWFPPVMPGTSHVTLGGGIASDVHGKNHFQAGSLGRHIHEMTILTANAGWQECSRTKNRDLFVATIGGMGLTGMILEAKIQMTPIETSMMVVEQQATPDFDSTLEFFAQNPTSPNDHIVAWCDLLATGRHFGQSLVMTGRHATIKDLPNPKHSLDQPKHLNFNLPFNLPGVLLNKYSMALLNSCFYNFQKRRTTKRLVDYQSFFFPLDTIGASNRIYGKKGLTQYQCVLPFKSAAIAFKQMFELISKTRHRAFMAVLKKFGAAGEGLLSFPCEGLTLAIDFPNRNMDLLPLLDKLDAIVIAHQGRTYLAKDSRMNTECFRAMYPLFDQWQKIKIHVDPRDVWSSDLSRRLQLRP